MYESYIIFDFIIICLNREFDKNLFSRINFQDHILYTKHCLEVLGNKEKDNHLRC